MNNKDYIIMTVAVTSRFNEEQFMNWSVYVNEHYLVHG